MPKYNLKIDRDNKIRPNDKHFTELYLIMLFMEGIMKEPRSTDLYKKGFIDEKGNIKRMPKTDREWQQFSLLEAFFIKIRSLLNPRLSNLSDFKKLGFGDFLSRYSDRIKLQGVNPDFKMKLTTEIMNKMFNLSPDDKLTF